MKTLDDDNATTITEIPPRPRLKTSVRGGEMGAVSTAAGGRGSSGWSLPLRRAGLDVRQQHVLSRPHPTHTSRSSD